MSTTIVAVDQVLGPSSEVLETFTHHHGPVLGESVGDISAFPGSWQFYNGKKTDPYFHTIRNHWSLSNKVYAYKRDLCADLMFRIYECPMKPLEAKFSISLVSYFLKTHEEKIRTIDMAPVHNALMLDVMDKIDCLNENFSTKSGWQNLVTEPFDFKDIENVVGLFIRALLFEQNWPLVEEKDLDRLQNADVEIRKLVKDFDKKIPSKSKVIAYRQILMWVISVVGIFGEFIKENSALMTSKMESAKKVEKSKTLVRLFLSGEEKIVMAHELLHQMESDGLDVSAFKDQIDAMPELSTISFRQVFEMVPKELIKNIEFIVMDEPYNTRPIPMVNGGYCILDDGKMVPVKLRLREVESKKDESIENVVEPIQEHKEAVESDSLSTTSESEVEKSTEVSEEKPKKRKKVKAIKMKKSSEELVKSEQKESESCPKCFRASLHTQKAYEKLRVDKIETKSLKKKLTEMEMENLKKDEKIRDLMMLVEMQKKELEEKDDVIRSQKNQMEENQKTMEMLQNQLEHKTELVEDLEAAISLAPVPENLPEASTPIRSQEQTENVREVLFILLNAQSILKTEKPIQKVLHMTNKLMAKSKNADVQKRARFETIKYRQTCTNYCQAVESNLAMIRANQQITVDQIPKLPAFPTLSKWYQDAYKETMKSDVPIICEPLTLEVNPDELADKECLICLDHMESEDATTKCECCKRRYHNECIQEWFQTKRSCPTCNSGLLDDQEFPTLS